MEAPLSSAADIDGVVRWLADESGSRVWNHDDQRHLCGAYRNNRTVPSEEILVSEIPDTQQALVTKIVDTFLEYIPISVREIRLQQIQQWYHETYFCWIGGFGDEDTFYYRIFEFKSSCMIGCLFYCYD